MKIILIVLSIAVAYNAHSLCGAATSYLTKGNLEPLQLELEINIQSFLQSCTRNWDDRGDVFVTVDNNVIQGTNGFLNSIVSLSNLTKLAYAQFPGQFVQTDQVVLTFHVEITRCCGLSSVWRKVVVYTYHGYRNKINQTALCSGKAYSYLETITPLAGYTGDWVFEDGQEFPGPPITFNQPFDNVISYTFNGQFATKFVTASFDVPINVIKNNYFTGVPLGLNNQSAAVALNTFSYSDPGGIREYDGNGVYQVGPNWVFDGSLSGPGNHTVYMRTNNNGCYSDYTDTLISVTGVASIAGLPLIDLESIFGQGETGVTLSKHLSGYYDYDGSWEPALTLDRAEVFHYACSDELYELQIINPEPFIDYEFKIFYHNQLYDQGIGNTFYLQSPSAVSVDQDVNLSQLTYFDFDSTTIMKFLQTPLGRTVYMGDPMQILIRKKNVLNQVGNWKKYEFGYIPKPVMPLSSKICYDDSVALVSVSASPVYLTSYDPSAFRKAAWDIDWDGDYEYNSDTAFNIPINTSKLNQYISRIEDKSLVKTFNWGSNSSSLIEMPSVDVVCYSALDTVKIIRKPIFDVAFNDTGLVDLGDAIRGIVSGVYFDPSNDTISWQYSDGSGVYFGDTLWHFMNDLGSYDLDIQVTDNYGCSSEKSYINNWYINGTLSTDHLNLSDQIEIFPNPASDVINIKCVGNINAIITTLSGQFVWSTEEKSVNLSRFSEGVYLITITSESKSETFKFIKL